MTKHTRYNFGFTITGVAILLMMSVDCCPSGDPGSGFLACVPERARQDTTEGYTCKNDAACKGLVCVDNRCRVRCEADVGCEVGDCFEEACR